MAEVKTADVYTNVPGQQSAIAQLRAAAASPTHAYLFIGPSGVGKHKAAQAFAAQLLCTEGGCGSCHNCVRALSGTHPDIVVVERKGASISIEQVRDVVSAASRSSVEGGRKVVVLNDFHLVEQAAPALLKTIEEPAADTFFVVLAEHISHDLVTIASRCVKIEFGPLPTQVVRDALIADGVQPDIAQESADASGGSLDRARLVASDPDFAERKKLWLSVPTRLDGTGVRITELADELLESVSAALGPLSLLHDEETVALAEREKLYGDLGSARKEMVDRHKREQRRARTDELRFGMATLASAYRDQLAGGASRNSARSIVGCIDAIQRAGEALERNPNEVLALQALLIELTF